MEPRRSLRVEKPRRAGEVRAHVDRPDRAGVAHVDRVQPDVAVDGHRGAIGFHRDGEAGGVGVDAGRW